MTAHVTTTFSSLARWGSPASTSTQTHLPGRASLPTTPTTPTPVHEAARLVRVDDPEWTHAAGGRITYRVFLGDRWVGWVGDGREWDGARFAGRRWWTCWRQDGDTAARWGSGLTARCRADAVAALVARVTAGDVTGGRS